MRQLARDITGRYAPPVILSGIVVSATLVAANHSEILRRVAIEDLVLLSGVIGFYTFVGHSGVLSFGHVCFVMIGGYTAGLLATPASTKQSDNPDLLPILRTVGTHPYVGCLIGGAAAAIFAMALSVPLMKLTGTAAALASFAVLVVVQVVASQWREVTNGVLGMSGVPTTTNITSSLATAVGAIFLAFLFQESRWGARLRASREDEVAARAIGISVTLERRIAFVVSAFVMGVVGGLYVEFLGAITPTTFYINTTFLLVLMLIVGGQTSLSGAVLGCLFVSVIRESLRQVEAGVHAGPVYLNGPTGLAEVGLAIILVLLLILRPSGITGGREVRVPGRLGRRDSGSAAGEA